MTHTTATMTTTPPGTRLLVAVGTTLARALAPWLLVRRAAR
jgi:hypothetical protein